MSSYPPIRIAGVLGGALTAFYILLPLDRGFPRLLLLGHPLNSAVVATLVVFSLMAIVSRGRILAHFTRKYVVLQTLYCLVLVEASLRSDTPLVALQVSLTYFCTFVLNYAILLEAVRGGQAAWFARIVAVVSLTAGTIAILQALGGIRMPMYQGWYESYYQSAGRDPTIVGVRGVGTLNQPVIFATAMALALPYMLTFRSHAVRVLAYSMVFIAAALTGSRTFLLGLATFAIGAFVVFRWRTFWAIAWIAIGLVVGIVSLGGWTRVKDDPRIEYLASRLGIVDSPEGDLATGNVLLRKAALSRGAQEVATTWGPLDWFLGKGQLSSSRLGEAVTSEFRTVDDAFFGIFYEKGLIGLLLFIWAFAVFLRTSYASSSRTLHWYAVIALLVIGLSFDFESYSTFNILAVASMAITTVVSPGWNSKSDSRIRSAAMLIATSQEF